MTLTLFMFALGGVEAVVHLWRYRSANRDGWVSSSFSAGAVQLLRVSGIGGVAASLDAGAWLAPAAAYVLAPVLVTAGLHLWVIPRSGRVDSGQEGR